jgi:hypothetical protein
MIHSKELHGHGFHFVNVVDFNETLAYTEDVPCTLDDYEINDRNRMFVPPEAHSTG